MKVPAPPPPWQALLATLSADRMVTFFQEPEGLAEGDTYLAWDTLRHKTPPAGLTSEEWWARIKLHRLGSQRAIPLLLDVDGRPFSYVLSDSVLRLNDDVTRRASGNISVSQLVTDPATRDRYVVSSLIEEAITSSQLEGAATSRRVAKEMLRSGRPARDRGEQMIRNNYAAMRRIVELRDEDLTPELVCEIHRIVTDETLDDPAAAGVLQDDDEKRVAVWGDGDQLLHRPPPVATLPARLVRLCDFANGADVGTYLPPALRAVAVHFMVGYDHYFEDGNGRTARALFYWTMLREGFWLTEFLTISTILKKAPSKYARSFILTEQDDGDLTHFFQYHLRVIARAIDDLHTYLGRKADEMRSLRGRLSAASGEFNHRQAALLQHAVSNPGTTFTAYSHSASHGVTPQTARNDLEDLERRGLLARIKVGRRFAWVPTPDLAERLGI